ncbi:two-component regulator propeller domain-containing protein [uncultured Bacteroides sp.]|uniref:two-component regulator propeller domain-containing protein n=1 Tax=uncultured Bacteroides sp. TaxID=162156 RepID=UPI0026141292|nr:two-component regulator propeller domain-containing protein [uncultured Bacteroides sp.]
MYSFHHSWEVNDGISQLSVVTICQDSRGYLWLGTRNGLNQWYGVYNLPSSSGRFADHCRQ